MSEVHKFTFDGYPAVKLNGVPYVRADSLEAMGYVKVPDEHICEGCKHKEFYRVKDDGRNFLDLLKDDLYLKAADLDGLGYVKVVRCGECKWLVERMIAERLLKKPLKMFICTSPHSHMKGIARLDTSYYCSEGEPKEAKPD